jgi:hypothetical protein
MRLTVKTQYKNFEPGEFVEIKERNYEEAIQLIDQFPWDKERQSVKIFLTNPSITIEGKRKDYLKLSVFYNQKYMLYYFNGNRTLFTKTLSNLPDANIYLKNYFEQPLFNTSGFKKEITWFQYNSKHFLTTDFVYKFTIQSVFKFLLSTCVINIFFTILMLILLFVSGLDKLNFWIFLLLLPVMFFPGAGLHLILFFNYYNNAKDKVLIMSKGNDYFYFGNKNHLEKYCKKEILHYKIIGGGNSRKEPFLGFEIIEKENQLKHIDSPLVFAHDFLCVNYKFKLKKI